jgi:hypothetical protein
MKANTFYYVADSGKCAVDYSSHALPIRCSFCGSANGEAPAKRGGIRGDEELVGAKSFDSTYRFESACSIGD